MCFGCIGEIVRNNALLIFLPVSQPCLTPKLMLRASERRGHRGIMPDGPKPPLAACDAPSAPWHSPLTAAEIAFDVCAQAFHRFR